MIGYKFNILTDREADTQVPDKQCHCGIFFTHSQAFNSHLDTDHQPEEGYPNGKWPCNEEPSCSKEYDEKGKVWRHIRQKHRISTVTSVCYAPLVMMRSMEF